MPIYEFECVSNKNHLYEIWRSVDERNTDTKCPTCGSEGKKIFAPIISLSRGILTQNTSNEPKLISKRRENNKQRLKSVPARPWMINRGC